MLSNTHHDGTTQQIDDLMGDYETENATFIRKATALHQCRVKEDEAWKKSQELCHRDRWLTFDSEL